MTTEEFLALHHSSKLKWELIRFSLSIKVRATSHKPRLKFCPITEVCYNLTGDYYDISNWRRAAEIIGLSQNEARMIVDAADNVGADSKLREQLLPFYKERA